MRAIAHALGLHQFTCSVISTSTDALGGNAHQRLPLNKGARYPVATHQSAAFWRCSAKLSSFTSNGEGGGGVLFRKLNGEIMESKIRDDGDLSVDDLDAIATVEDGDIKAALDVLAAASTPQD